MATSGSVNYNETRSSIISRALRIVGAASRGMVLTAETTDEASKALNALVKSLQNENVMLHTRRWITQTLTASSSVMGTTSGEYYECIRPHTTATATRPTTGANWESYWRVTETVNATAWAADAAKTAICQFDMPTGYISIEQAFYRDDDTNDDRGIDLIRYTDFLDLPVKYSDSSVPLMMAVDGAYPTQQIHLWPYPSDSGVIINMLAVRSLEDFDANGDEPDFPVRFANLLIYGLADSLADEYHIPIDERQIITGKFMRYLAMARKRDVDRGRNCVRPSYFVRNSKRYGS